MAGFRSGCVFLAALARVSAFVQVPHVLNTGAAVAQRETTSPVSCRMALEDVSESRQDFLKDSAVGLAAGAVGLSGVGASPDQAGAAGVSAWEQIQLPVASVLYDIAFDAEHPDHGLVVGAQGTFLEVSPRCVICCWVCCNNQQFVAWPVSDSFFA